MLPLCAKTPCLPSEAPSPPPTVHSPFLTALTSKGFSPNFARSLLKTRDRSIRVYLRSGASRALVNKQEGRTGRDQLVLRTPGTGPHPHQGTPNWGDPPSSWVLGLLWLALPTIPGSTHNEKVSVGCPRCTQGKQT